MEPDLEVRPEDAPHDALPEDDLSVVQDKAVFHSMVLWNAGMGYFLDDGIFDCNGSALLIRGEY